MLLVSAVWMLFDAMGLGLLYADEEIWNKVWELSAIILPQSFGNTRYFVQPI